LAELEFGNEDSLYKEKNKIALMEFLSIIAIKHFDENAAKEFDVIKKYLKDNNSMRLLQNSFETSLREQFCNSNLLKMHVS
jgi:cellobiose phosphorylase